MTIRLALTGTGYISRVHAAAARAAGAELVAVVNYKPESMARFAGDFRIPRQHATIGDLVSAGGVDAVIVGTPNYLHAPETIAALNAGLHVMVEKPMSLNRAEAEAMVNAGLRSGALLMVAHCWRFDTEAIWLRDQVRAGKIGQVIRTKGYGVHVNWGPSGWFTQKRFAGGGAMADMGIHAVDTARFLMSDPLPVSVYARIGTYYKEFDVDDTGTLMVTWDNGAMSYMESGWWQPHSDGSEAGTQLYGRAGVAQLFPTGLRLAGAAAFETQFASPRESGAGDKMYLAQMAYFLDCIGARQTPVPGGQEGWVNMQVVDAAYESARTGAVVKIN